jgi:Tol biopolymer transport system component
VTPGPVAPATGRIAFIRTADPEGPNERRDVWIVGADGSSLRQLTNDPMVELDLSWLRDGSRLVVVWERPADPYHQFLASMLPDGSDRTELGPVQTAYGAPQRSPDGRYVAFGGDGVVEGDTGVVLLDLDTGTRRVLASNGATQPIWSPDGSRIVAYLPSRELAVFDVATGARLFRLRADVAELIGWAPGGEHVYFVGCDETMNKTDCIAAPILIAGLDGSGPSPAQDLDARIVGTVSPDGRWVAVLDPSCSYRLEPIDDVEPIDLRTAIEIEAGCDSPYSTVSWSPDSTWLATASGSSLTRSVITLITPLGPDLVEITPGPSEGRPAWQPA